MARFLAIVPLALKVVFDCHLLLLVILIEVLFFDQFYLAVKSIFLAWLVEHSPQSCPLLFMAEIQEVFFAG